MSGEAGAILQSDYYLIQYSSGIRVSVAEPPDWDWEKNGDYTSHYFKTENQHYQNKLNQLKPELDRLFANLLRNSNLPITWYDPNAPFFASTSFNTQHFEHVEITIAVSIPLPDDGMSEIQTTVAHLFDTFDFNVSR